MLDVQPTGGEFRNENSTPPQTISHPSELRPEHLNEVKRTPYGLTKTPSLD